MNKRIQLLAEQAELNATLLFNKDKLEKFAKLIVEETLDQVKERAYYTGDRDWSDEVDRQWIQLEFGYGPLAEMKK